MGNEFMKSMKTCVRAYVPWGISALKRNTGIREIPPHLKPSSQATADI